MMQARRNEHGFFTLWTLGLCVCMFFVGGLSLDLWRGFSDRRELAAMTDAAAIAAANQIDLAAFRQQPSVLQLDPEAARQRATEYMVSEAAESNIELTDLQIAIEGPRVQIVATKTLDVSLTRILLPGEDLTVSTTSAAEPQVNE